MGKSITINYIENLDGKITICRTGLLHEDCIRLDIHDKNSSVPVIKCEISMDEFMRALTGCSERPMKMKVNTEAHKYIGKKLIVEELVVAHETLKEMFAEDYKEYNRDSIKLCINKYFEVLKNTGELEQGYILYSSGVNWQQNDVGKHKFSVAIYK